MEEEMEGSERVAGWAGVGAMRAYRFRVRGEEEVGCKRWAKRWVWRVGEEGRESGRLISSSYSSKVVRERWEERWPWMVEDDEEEVDEETEQDRDRLPALEEWRL
jgi:hypothetical protein